jgi:predicted nucleic acid-binding protein
VATKQADRDVLLRPPHLAAFGLSSEEVETFLAAMVTVSEHVAVRYLWRPNLRDEGDNFIVEIAVAASPCTIITHNWRDFQGGEIRFSRVTARRPQEILMEGVP